MDMTTIPNQLFDLTGEHMTELDELTDRGQKIKAKVTLSGHRGTPVNWSLWEEDLQVLASECDMDEMASGKIARHDDAPPAGREPADVATAR